MDFWVVGSLEGCNKHFVRGKNEKYKLEKPIKLTELQKRLGYLLDKEENIQYSSIISPPIPPVISFTEL